MENISILIGLSLLIFPGYVCLMPFKSCLKFNGVEYVCAASGLTLAILPLILYITSYLHFVIGQATAWGVIIITAFISIWDIQTRFARWYHIPQRPIPFSYLLLSVIFLLALYPRLSMAQDITYPLWTDSYHHTIISQLIAEQGTIPHGYAPYAPVEAFTYHFGFHTLVAWFHWLTQVPIPRAVVIMGQLINALVVPTTYLLSRQLWRKQTAALIAALAVGSLFHMPALFINWGRYPQLTGQILLPILIVLTLRNFERPIYARRLWLLIGLILAGLFLVHVRIFLFYGVFAVWAWLFELWHHRHQPERLKGLLSGALIVGSTMLLIDSLWLWEFIRGFGAKVVSTVAAGYNPQDQAAYLAITMEQVFAFGVYQPWLISMLISLIWGLRQQNKATISITLWFITLLIIANVHFIQLVPLFSNVIVIIYLYLPTALLLGYGVAQIDHFLQQYLNPYLRIGLGIALLLGSSLHQIGFIQSLLSIDSMLLRPADLQAMTWLKNNIPPQTLFFIQGHFWVPQLVHGVDGGYWLPYITGRETTIPGEFYGSDGTSDYINFINQRAIDLSTTDPLAFWQAVNRYGITHIYLGQRRHELDPALFLAHPNQFKTIYHQDEVWVFEIIKPLDSK